MIPLTLTALMGNIFLFIYFNSKQKQQSIEIERLKNCEVYHQTKIEHLTSGLDMIWASYYREKDENFSEIIQ